VDNFSKNGGIFYISQVTSPGNVEKRKKGNVEKEEFMVSIFINQEYEYF